MSEIQSNTVLSACYRLDLWESGHRWILGPSSAYFWCMYSGHIHPKAITKILGAKREFLMASITPSYLSFREFCKLSHLQKKTTIKGIYFIFEGLFILIPPLLVDPKTLDYPKVPLDYSQSSGMESLGKALSLTGPWLSTEWTTLPILSRNSTHNTTLVSPWMALSTGMKSPCLRCDMGIDPSSSILSRWETALAGTGILHHLTLCSDALSLP